MQNNNTILGINPGTRYMGFAVIRDNDLREWKVKVLRAKTNKEKCERAIQWIKELIEQYQPDIISIKKLHPSRISPPLKILVNTLTTAFQDVPVKSFTIEDIKNKVAPNLISNKKELGKALAAYFPVLYHELNREEGNKNPYLSRMFEAVGLAAVVDKL